jgi:hypothetical protein
MMLSIIAATTSSTAQHFPLPLCWLWLNIIDTSLRLRPYTRTSPREDYATPPHPHGKAATAPSHSETVSNTSLSSRAAHGGKRARSAVDDENDENDKNTRKSLKRDRLGPGSAAHKFACPYFKRNPQKCTRWRACCGPGWISVHRVK